MKLKVDKKYLTIPVNTNVSLKKVKFYDVKGALVFDLDVRIDMISPNFTAYVDISRFAGQELTIACDPEMEFDVKTTDVFAPDAKSDPYRPKIHFSVKNGWNNDPNGLIKHSGVYHMFYQYNPCCSDWGNMHWGHAVSSDLIKWEELDVALFPDENGTVYSGCAIEDKNRVSGLGDKLQSEPPLLLYYTAASNNLLSAGKKYTQRIAVMQNGRIEKYSDAPAVDYIEGGNRDPKVVWSEELGKYVMALYLAKKRFTLFTSDDLLHWDRLQDIEIFPDRECPDIYPLECDGEKLWVFSGASDYYTVGRFENGKFATAGSVKRLSVAGMNYAAQSFSGIDDGRTIRIYWQKARIPSKRFTQQMSIPVEMSLSKEGEEYYLSALPVREIEAFRGKRTSLSQVSPERKNAISLSSSPIDIVFNMPYVKDLKTEITVFGSKITIDTKENTINYERNKIPLRVSNGDIDLRIIVDRCSIEIFADKGRILFADALVCDYNLPFVSVNVNKAIEPTTFDIYELDA